MNVDQKRIVSFLKEGSTYPHKVSKVEIKETHISWVFLTGKFAYKVKKEVKFGGILDFTTLHLRKKFCQKEIDLNRVLCKGMYRDVVKIIEEKGKPEIVNLQHRGKPLEYAVKMLEIPQKYLMDNLVINNRIDNKTVDNLVNILVRFHHSTPTSRKIKKFGSVREIMKTVNENFTTLSKLTKVNPLLERKLVQFVQNNRDLFNQRIKENKIRDIHGDLHLQNIFVVKNKFYLYDRIEFNDSLRYGDVANDVGHLAMDFDYYGKENLRKHFVSRYISKSGDKNLDRIIYFMMCFKACVRAKVSQFRANNESDARKRLEHINESKNRFKVAESYLDFF